MSSKTLGGLALILACLSGFTPAPAAVLLVPGNYTSIQSALDAANTGDVILVSPGVYNENVNFKGKAVTLSSTNASDPTVVANTFIHGLGSNSVVTFAAGEGSNSILTGFTISGGSGTVNLSFGSSIAWGAGIYCYNASPTIVGNLITANTAPDGSGSTAGYGGGIACIQSDAIISRNIIVSNNAYAGGGILVYLGKPRIVSNVIWGNAATVGGGAVLLDGGQFVNNTVVANAAPGGAGNLYAASTSSGQVSITGNLVCNATTGGGIYVDSQDQFTQIAYNDVWNNIDGDYLSGQDHTGVNGNISQDPQWIDPANQDFHLQEVSPCINADDPQYQAGAGELDVYGDPRISFGRVDIGAVEYFDSIHPSAEAGPDQWLTVTSLPARLTLDGSGSSDPNGAPLTYVWTQLSGPSVTLAGAGAAKPSFQAPALGTYVFQLIVNNGTLNSFPDVVQITLTNAPPVADAGICQRYDEGAPRVTLDGSGSSDPEKMPLSYRWSQLSGWNVSLSDPAAAKPSFDHPWPGAYAFQLVVNDGLQDSQPAVVSVVIGPNHPPVANAGPARYVSTNTVMLDGTGSYDPDTCGTLGYQWQQLSGPTVTLTGADTATPLVSGFVPRLTPQQCVFQLTVNDGELNSQPATVTVTIVPSYGANTLYLENPPFDPDRPTILAFSGGNCSTGVGMSFGGVWDQQANWLTVPTYTTAYNSYGDMLMVYLSDVAPNYHRAIETIGFSTGNKPAMQAAVRVNTSYQDPRFAVNRVALCDAVCNNLAAQVAQFNTNPVAGEQCWVDNYISNDPGYSRASSIPSALNVTCIPARSHSYPVSRYQSSSLDYTNGGLTAFGYLSVIGAGKNYQLNTTVTKYFFRLDASEQLVLNNATLYPGKVLAPVELAGPPDNSSIGAGGEVLTCAPVENAVHYQLLFGSQPDRVQDFSIVSDSTNPPDGVITNIPSDNTWWTVKAYDAFDSFIYADPRLIRRPENRPPVAQTGPDQVLYAGLDGMATLTLDGSQSIDPDGDNLTYIWAWVLDGQAYVTNVASLSLQLPVGVYTFQLMVNDGRVSSPPAAITVTVVAPIACDLQITPSTLVLGSRWNGPSILAHLEFPKNLHGPRLQLSGPPSLYPADTQAEKVWTLRWKGKSLNVFALFDRDALQGLPTEGRVELTVAGKLTTGQWYYGRDTVRIITVKKAR